MSWFCAYTTPRSEFLAAGDLFVSGYTVLNLHYRERVRHARRQHIALRPRFPRYLFVEIGDGQSFWEVNNTRGVHSILAIHGKPLEVPFEEVMKPLLMLGDENGLIEPPA